MAKPTTRKEFADFILRQLGYPVQEVHVDPEQIYDAIDVALEQYRQYHFDGAERIFMKHKVEQADKDSGSIKLPDVVQGVIRILPIAGGTTSTQSLFSIKYHITANELYNLGTSSMIPYQMAMMRISELYEMFDNTPSIEFVRHRDRVIIPDWTAIEVGSYLVMEVERYLDPAEFADVWSDLWLQRYSVALVKKQWGNNLKVYTGVQLPGGISLNGQQIYSEAVDEIEMLEQKLLTRYGRPLRMQTG